jgi:hypothetical protein
MDHVNKQMEYLKEWNQNLNQNKKQMGCKVQIQ